jgi:hypothetical protein
LCEDGEVVEIGQPIYTPRHRQRPKPKIESPAAGTNESPSSARVDEDYAAGHR